MSSNTFLQSSAIATPEDMIGCPYSEIITPLTPLFTITGYKFQSLKCSHNLSEHNANPNAAHNAGRVEKRPASSATVLTSPSHISAAA